jgi:hypothetical protein
MLLSLAACAASQTARAPHEKRGVAAGETEVVARVRYSEEGMCDVPGRPELAGQTRVRLVYVEWPHFFEEFCSSDLAERLRKTSAKEVSVTVSFDPKGRGHAICNIDRIAGNRLERGCSFEGVLSGGWAGYGHQSKGGYQLKDADLPPWEARARPAAGRY